jgi:hypothetical protein
MAAGFWLLLIAVAVGGAFLIFGTQSGRTLAFTDVCFFVSIWLLGLIVGVINKKFPRIREYAKSVGGWDIAFDNFLFELRPTLTENQKIQKIAGRELRLLETQQIRAYREAKRRARVQRQQMAEKAAQDRSRDRAHQRMVKDVRRLEQKFGQVGGLYFNYSNVGIEIYRGGVGARVGELIARVRCYGTPTSFAYDLEMAEWFAAKKGETFSSERPMMQYLRKALRQAAAETVARRAAAQRSHDAASRGGQSRGAMRS